MMLQDRGHLLQAEKIFGIYTTLWNPADPEKHGNIHMRPIHSQQPLPFLQQYPVKNIDIFSARIFDATSSHFQCVIIILSISNSERKL